MLRGKNSVVWYYDGKAVHTQATDDTGEGHNLLLDITTGSFGGPVSVYGPASDMKVAYVRAWTP
jgi:beta-glucanase (GH16 family)